jgi:hypothetical protein
MPTELYAIPAQVDALAISHYFIITDGASVAGTGRRSIYDLLLAFGLFQMYGQIYVHDGVTAQAIAAGSTPVKLTCFNTTEGFNGLSKVITNDKANSKVTIGYAGNFRITAQLSFTNDVNNVTHNIAIFVNGVEVAASHAAIRVSSASDVESFQTMALVSASAGHDVDIRMYHGHATPVNITPIFASLTVEYIGPT